MSILDPSEEEIFNKPAIFEKEKVTLILSNIRLVIAKKKAIIKDINYHLIEKIKYTKKDEPNPDEKTTSKFRILDAQENKIDISFKGVDSPENLKNAIRILKQKKAEADRDNYREQEADSSEHRSKSDTGFKGYQYAKGNPPSESKLKAKIFRQNPTVLSLYDNLSQKEIKNDNLFWVNFKAQLANQLSSEGNQQSGYSGRYLSEVVADDTKSRGNQFSFTLDDNIKRQILRKKTRVADRYISYMNEKEKAHKKDEDPELQHFEDENTFWQQYFATHLRDNSITKSRKDKDKYNIFDSVSIKDTICFNEKSRAKRAKNIELPARVGSLYESINPIDNSSYGCGCGQGIFNKELLPQLLQSTVDSYNIHSELSLIDNEILPDTTREINDNPQNDNQDDQNDKKQQEPELDDLKPQKEINLSTLNTLNEVAKPPYEAVDPIVFKNEAERFANKFSDFNENFNKLPPPPQPPMRDAVIILRDMTGETSNFYNYNKINSQRTQIYYGLDEVRKHKIEEQVLLFLFWNNYLSAKPDQEFEQKIVEEIRDLKKVLTNEKNMLTNDESNRALSPLYDEMEDSIDQVLNLFTVGSTPQSVNIIPENLDEYSFF